MTQSDDSHNGAQEDLPRPVMLGERLTVLGELLRRRHLPVYAWAAGFAPVLARVESLSQSWERRFERDESGEPLAAPRVPRPSRPTGFLAEQALTSHPQQTDFTKQPTAAAEPIEGQERALPVDVRAGLRKVAGSGADHIRVRADAAADATARSHRADAVTIGAEVRLRAGQFRPDTPEGFALLAHEASHVTALLTPGGVGRRTSATGVAAEEKTAGQVEWLVQRQHPLDAGHSGHAPGPPSAPRRRTGVPAGHLPGSSTPGLPQVAAAPSSAAAVPMRAEVDRGDAPAPAPVDVEGLRQGLIDDVMYRLRTDFERGG